MSTELQDKLSSLLAASGFSNTRSRLQVFLVLNGGEPITMHELTERLHGTIDRASVYRTVALFEKLGIVQRLQIGWKYKIELTDAFHEHHHHLLCTSCGDLVPLPEDTVVESFIAGLAQNQGFLMSAHQLEIQGLCQKCQPKPLY